MLIKKEMVNLIEETEPIKHNINLDKLRREYLDKYEVKDEVVLVTVFKVFEFLKERMK